VEVEKPRMSPDTTKPQIRFVPTRIAQSSRNTLEGWGTSFKS
jgi:hypothetical protein